MFNIASFRLVLLLPLVLLMLCGTPPATVLGEDAGASDTEQRLEAATSTQEVEAMVARLSDSEIRALVLSKLSENIDARAVQQTPSSGLSTRLHQWLHALDKKEEVHHGGGARLLPFFLRIPGELGRSVLQIGEGRFGQLIINVLIMALVFGFGSLAEWFFRRLTGRTAIYHPPVAASDDGEGRFWGAVVGLLPPVMHLTAFAFASIVFFLLFANEAVSLRVAFMALLGTIVGGRGLSLISRFLCSPDSSAFRLLPLDDRLAAQVHRGFQFFVWYTVAALMLLSFLESTGMAQGSRLALGAVLGTGLLLLIAVKIVLIREPVARQICAARDDREAPWALRQFASMWHFFALLYLFAIWSIWINTILTGTGKDNGALIISLLIVPIYLLFDRIGVWLVGTIVTALELRGDAADEAEKQERLGEAYVSPEEKERRLITVMLRAYRAFIVLILIVWMMALWGVDFPLAGNIVQAAFDILITLTLALFVWRYISRFIERKIQESLPEEQEQEADDGGEFGATRQLGRTYTLLPMIRKFIATTLMVMVSLIVLSSIGVDIGPLLAGAGVIGLAVGFGAQKLVSDVLSGVFYLLDDAFRVGEYIQAGSVKGAVENITLRNVMLRHHRGMLQIVPHSELGSITNFMRGGIVVKFNLEFPYDTDVELVRKTIKKVGQAMLQDEELGPDFILPVKSQGVYEITNSVMVIRVKFTAKPGRQFLIRREAFRRITEALAAKGVHYAHRKVIVEVPQVDEQHLSPEKVREVVEAGAAAGEITLEPKPSQGQGTEENKLP